MHKGFSLEIKYEIWDDESGSRIEVGPDRDSLGLIEIRLHEAGKTLDRISMTVEQAKLVAQAINKAAYDLGEEEKGN